MGVKDHAMPYWKRYPLDYAMDTAHLTLAEHGAYSKLLDRYYLDGKLAADKPRLYVICACRTEEERAAVDRVIAQYFTACETGLRQERVEREIEEYRQFRASRSRAGDRGAAARAAMKEEKPRPAKRLNGARATFADSGDIIERIPLNTGEEFDVRTSFVAELERSYPAVDVPLTLREIRAWCVSNPKQCKTATGVRRFLNSWIAREQNKGGIRGA